MIKLSGSVPFPKCLRVAAYALLAALVTTLLFAVEASYRWYHNTSTQVAAPVTRERPVEASDPAPVASAPAPLDTQHANAPSEVLTGPPDREAAGLEEPAEDRPVTARTPSPAIGPIPEPAAAPTPSAAGAEVVPQQAQPSLDPKRQQVRRLPAKQAARNRTAPRRAVPAGKPNVYWERDPQLGFASQLRKRTCNPATGQMPMQCYYPREGRERFPAKPLN